MFKIKNVAQLSKIA